MKQRSIRFRLTVWYTMALAIALVLFAAAVWVAMRQSLVAGLDQTLQQRVLNTTTFIAAELAEHAALPEELSEFSHAFPAGTYLQVRDRTGRLVFTSDSSSEGLPVRGYRKLEQTVEIGGVAWRISLAASMSEIERQLSLLRLLLAALIPPVIAISAFCGNWLSRKALKPVDDITAAARHIGISNLSERLTVNSTGDEIQRLAETWNSMLARLESAVKRLARFTADASHELRTPLALIRSTAEIAARKPRSAESYRESLEQIVTESERMTHLVEDLLFLARCDVECSEMPMQTLDFAALVHELCGKMRPLAESRNITLTSIDLETPLPVFGNEPALRRLVLVLIDNAIKYTNPGGEVKISMNSANDQFSLHVSDTGPGIAREDLPHIFERFYRASAARSGGGTGLGLSLAAGIAERHKARIDVTSDPCEGSTFRVSFQRT